FVSSSDGRGSWTAPIQLNSEPSEGGHIYFDMAASSTGHLAVAWNERHGYGQNTERYRIQVAYKAPGSAWTAAHNLQEVPSGSYPTKVSVAFHSPTEGLVVWRTLQTRLEPRGRQEYYSKLVHAAIANGEASAVRELPEANERALDDRLHAQR